ncbi:hypothetical protein GCM10009808_04850 [Microbacterium sediminicola]|uniref:Nitrate ABC transporter substrate-binding protein n=1 Tax=Microbacterium sediminicola TaxID=415210 RepID=A0ABP4TP82_9MICO
MRRPSIAACAALTLLPLLAACSTTPDSTVTATPTSAPSADADPAAAPTPTPTATMAADAEPTCETIIPPSLVEELTAAGWTAREDDFYAVDSVLDGGILCQWADYDAAASDHVLVYGWAPLGSGDKTRLQSELVAQGWIREDGPDGVYITEDPSYSVSVDENGYGMTYLFGEDWVKVSDTKQGLVLIDWPPSS